MKVYNINSQSVKIADFSIHAVVIGENGRGRKIVNVACPETFEFLEPGVTKQDKPRLNKSDSSKGWIAKISSEGAYIRGANGNISVSSEFHSKITLLVKANGAFGDAGRTGTWDDIIISTELEDFWIRVKPSRGDAHILLFKDSKVSKVSYEEADLLEFNLEDSTPTKRGNLIRL